MPSEKFDGHPTPSLALDPGTPTRRSGKSISGCKCILLTIALLVLSSVGLFLFYVFEGLVVDISQPHRALFENLALEDVTNRATVVQPLISRAQTFDIAATVWMRKTERIGHGEVFAMEGSRSQVASLLEEAGLGEQIDQLLDSDDELETPIFSEIVFRDLHLTDKYVFTTVNFSLPTAVFRTANLSNFDLRGSFNLIPSSSSLLDHITNYSSWLPDEVKPFPTRSWPFPLGSGQSEKSLADKAIESFGVTIPLLSFHGVHTLCPGDSIDVPSSSSEEEEDEDEPPNQPPLDDSKNLPLLKTTNGKPLLESHPYVVTRTQIHVVDQTKLFNRKAYMKAHRVLKATACGKTISNSGGRPNRYLCDVNYKANGHWITQMQLGLDQPNGKVRTEWAYSPYMAATHISAGPKDLLMIPVNRENCTNAKPSEPKIPLEQDSINVSWKLSYSGRTPVKHTLSTFVGTSIPHNFSQSDHHETLAQESAEISLGLAGHRFSEDSHPRRRAILTMIGGMLAVFVIMLDIRYWYTRRSTVTISILGTALIAGADLFVQIASSIAKGRLDQLSVSGWIATLLFTLVTSLVLPLLMLKAIARIEFGWWKGTTWIPVMQRACATHKERASERLEAKTPWQAQAGLFFSLVVLYFAVSPHTCFIIPSILPAPSPGDFAEDRLAELSPYFIHPLYVTGKILQLILNRRSKSYAGSSNMAAVLLLAMNLSTLASFVPSLVGRYDARPGLSMHEAVDTALLVATVLQALTLPSVSQKSEDEHED